jgi:hypothetical protein
MIFLFLKNQKDIVNMGKSAQLVRSLDKKLKGWDLKKAIKFSKDEATSRDFLIHPFLEMLDSERIDDYTHEYSADIKGRKGTKVDIAVTFGKKSPVIVIECKKAGQKLSDRNHL